MCFVVDLFNLRTQTTLYSTLCYVCVCEGHLWECSEVAFFFFVRPNVLLSSPSAIVKGLGASFLVNALVLLQKSETLSLCERRTIPPRPLRNSRIVI